MTAAHRPANQTAAHGPPEQSAAHDPAGQSAAHGPAEQSAARGPAEQSAAHDLAVVLHDLAWLLPRTVGLAAARQDPLPQSELEVMRLLVRRPGLSVNDVARELGLQPSNASTAIRLQIARGTLERRADRADGRVARLYPTSAAYAARDRREYSWGAALSEVLDGLAPADRRRLAKAAPALRRLATRLAGDPGPGLQP